jgi:hypothetical protein
MCTQIRKSEDRYMCTQIRKSTQTGEVQFLFRPRPTHPSTVHGPNNLAMGPVGGAAGETRNQVFFFTLLATLWLLCSFQISSLEKGGTESFVEGLQGPQIAHPSVNYPSSSTVRTDPEPVSSARPSAPLFSRASSSAAPTSN